MKFTLYTSDYAGKPQNTVYPNEVVIASADDMKKAVSFDHVCAKYKNSRRSNDNFISSDVVSLECDNDHSDKPDDWITPKMLEDELSGVNFVIVSSRHSMKPKGKKSARPRFHMFFPSDTCSDAKAYAELKQQIYKEFPFFDNVSSMKKRIEKAAKICYNENNDRLRKQKGGFLYGTNSNFLRYRRFLQRL